MFGLFKPKMSISDMALVNARVTFKVAASSAAQELKDSLTAEGADRKKVALELGAFTSFCFWAGASYALQKGKITGENFEALMLAFEHHLASMVEGTDLDSECLELYGVSFSYFNTARMESFCTITTEVQPDGVMSAIVDAFCEFLGVSEPSGGLRLIAKHNYLLTEGSVYDRVAGIKLV
jgi:hypothetical protein